ncbi:hypothetical protein Bca52824_034112 [Brassica carinata]|uniref:Major facilitator superfamily (MFS) profile domain-containing protein n=1 Tax=Brassica carinata TaxID=52824 RepID=A0A8X7V945_BRACI|nr:hypothetical protein Bca52824_034112 [Brassica carinata]
MRERERKFPNEDVLLETGLSRKSPREVIKKAQDDDGECRVTTSVFLSTFVAVSGSFCSGCGAGYSSGAQSGITKDLSLSVAEYSMFGSILTLGGLIGAIFSGKVADVLGRKRTMLFCEAFCVTGWLAVALAKDALWLDCGRLLLGIGVGLFSYVIPVYIAEIAPKHVRGSFVFANQLMQNCGIALFFIIGNFVPWRLLAIVGEKGRDKDCRTALQCLRGSDVDISREANTIRAGYSSGAQSGITKDLSLSVAEYSMFGSILTLGGLIGAIFSGKVADVLGRKRTMLFCEAFCVTGWLAVALAKDALWLDCGRLLLGIGVGLFSYVIPVYIAEIAPKHVRGSFVFANQLMQNCGIALFFIIGNFVPWRLLAIVGFVPCVLHIFCLFFIPESPRWLAKKGRDKDCRTALQCLRGSDVDISREANTIRDTIEMSEVDGETRMAELFQRRYAYPLFIGVGLMFLQQLSGSSGVTYYASSLFQKGGFSSAVGTSVIATMMVPKAMMGTIIVDKLERRTLLMASCAAMGLSALLLSVSYSFQSFGILPNLTPIFTCIGVLGHTVTFALGMGGLPWIIMAEIFPMNVKVSAGTLVTVTNWLFGWIVTYTFNFMLEWNASGFLESLWRDVDMNRHQVDPSSELNLVIVSHGLTSRVFLMKWFKWTVEEFERLNNLGNCEFRVMELGAGGEYTLGYTTLKKRCWLGACLKAAAAGYPYGYLPPGTGPIGGNPGMVMGNPGGAYPPNPYIGQPMWQQQGPDQPDTEN